MSAEPKLRVGFSGLLHCLSPLHVGDGGVAASKGRPANGRQPLTEGHYNTVCLDHQGHPYIPGSTLRGAMLALLGARNSTLTAVLAGDQARAGKLRVEAACLVASSLKATKLPYWDGQRGTYLHRGVGIEPVTRTADADAHALFQHELVAPGAVFCWQIWLERPNDEMVELVKATLEDWRGQWSCAVGHGRSKGWGRLRYELEQIKTLTAAGLREWRDEDADKLPYQIENASPGAGSPLQDSGVLRLSLLPRTPFLVNEEYFAEKREGDGKMPLAFKRTADGHAWIPSSTLKGWLRNRAHKIAATIVHQQFEVSVENAWEWVAPMIQTLFGREASRSQLWIDDAVSDKPAGIETFMMNAIDRFTGGVSVGDSYHLKRPLDKLSACNLPKRGGALFKVEAAECDRLDCRMEWDRRRSALPEDWQKGLLLLVARDALEGELRLGWGQAKGFGDFTIQFRDGESVIGAWEDLLKVLRQEFDERSPENWVTALHQNLALQVQTARTRASNTEQAAS